MRLRVATYNVHRCRGMDSRVRPDRIVAVLREIAPDIAALQEVVSAEDGAEDAHQARYIAEQLGLNWTLGENRKLEGAAYGNVVLSRFPLNVVTNHDLSVGRRERRGALHTDVRLAEDDLLHVFNIHLGTAFLERRHQGRRLSDRNGGILHNDELKGAKIVLGDFNEWTSGLATQLLGSHLKSVDIKKYLGRSKTYPAFLPFMHLDHIYYDGPLELQGLTLHRSRTALMASDHMPLFADFEYLGRAATGPRADAGAAAPGRPIESR
jgi:endonuclease/exonuclease/phosphatase family metal-dependent hydrolase